MKNKISISLTFVSLLTLTACGETNNSVKNNSSSTVVEVNEQVIDKIEKITSKTKDELKKCLDSDILSLKFDLDANSVIVYDTVTNVYKSDDIDSILREETTSEKRNLFLDFNTIANFDLSYYEDLNKNGFSNLDNITNIYADLEFDLGSKYDLELGITKDKVVKKDTGGLIEEEINPEVHVSIGNGLNYINELINLSNQGFIEYMTSILLDSINSMGLDKETINMVIEFFNGKVSSAELLEYYLSITPSIVLEYEEKNFIIGLLDYIKNIDLNSTFVFKEIEKNKTYSMDFDYNEFNKLLDKTANELKTLATRLKPEESKAMEVMIDELLLMIKSYLPLDLDFKVVLGTTNQIITALDINLDACINMLVGMSNILNSETNEINISSTYMTKVEFDFSFGFEFGQEKLDIPTLNKN